MARRRASPKARNAKGRRGPTSSAHGAATAVSDASAGTLTGTSRSSDAVEPEALVVTHWFDSGDEGDPYSATVRVSGRRVGIRGTPKATDTFIHEDTVERIVPGSGPVSITSWVYGLHPGEWTVTARLIRGSDQIQGDRSPARWTRPSVEAIDRASWSWRAWGLDTATADPMRTRWALAAPLAKSPAVIPGSFTVLGALGIVVALVVQSAILAGKGVPLSGSLTASLVALVSGLLGAKVWYAVLHPGPWRQAILGGWAVDGFVVVSAAVAFLASIALGLPAGTVLDATAPGMFFAVAIGRVGCFLTGCCAGRCTNASWGIWSSDRRVGARRIPAQLLESATGLAIGVISGLLVLGDVIAIEGVVFVLAIGAYILARHALLRLRAERRDYLWRRSTMVGGHPPATGSKPEATGV